MKPLPSCETVRDLLSYDPTTGDLVWKKKASQMMPGSRAGWQQGKYHQVQLFKTTYWAHRIIWLIVTGEWPERYIDHINGDGSDNRWSNLRAATAAQNAHNSVAGKLNRSGCRGVHWHSGAKKWRVQIKRRHLGYFTEIADAQKAYRSAALIERGEFDVSAERMTPALRGTAVA